jgi:hypothetical protein
MTQLIKSELQHPKCGLSVAQMCGLAQITRGQFYRHRRAASVAQSDWPLSEAVKAVALEMPAYGYRRVTAHLRRNGRAVNGKTVLRSMRHQNLLCKGVGVLFAPPTAFTHIRCIRIWHAR